MDVCVAVFNAVGPSNGSSYASHPTQSPITGIYFSSLLVVLAQQVHGIDLCRVAAMLVREHRFHTLSLELTSMGMSSRGAKEKSLVPQDSIWLLCDKSLWELSGWVVGIHEL